MPSGGVTTWPCNRIIQVSSGRKSYTKLFLQTHVWNNSEQGGNPMLTPLSTMHATCHFLLMNNSHGVSPHVLGSLTKIGKHPSKGKTTTNQIKPKEKRTAICLFTKRCMASMDHSEGLTEASPTTCRATRGQ